MTKLDHLKEIGKQFQSQIGKYKTTAKKAVAGVLASAALTSCTGSCTQGAEADYLDGISTELLETNKADINAHIDAYEKYWNNYETQKKEAAECLANGDVKGARLAERRAKELMETIRETEKRIDDLKDEKLDLEQYKDKGEIKAKANGTNETTGRRHFKKE